MQINSKNLNATFNTLGAELKSLKFKDRELLWQGKEKLWPQTAPVLFPFCGFLKNSFYLHEDTQYEAPAHGFTATSEFKIESKTDSKISFSLSQNDDTKKQYPFDFKLTISYELNEEGLCSEFIVENTSKENPLPFSIGWHPGFNYSENSHIKLSQNSLIRRTVSKEGLIGKAEKLELKNGILPLNNSTFKNGGIVIEKYNSDLSLETAAYQIDFNFKEFPNLVLWGQPGANFVCIEPWFGMGDTIGHDNIFTHKEYLIYLSPGERKSLKSSLKIKA